MKRITQLILEAFITFFVLFFLLEAALRIFPGLIPQPLLVNFQGDIREKIARRLNLPVLSDSVLLERDDSGPPLHSYKPLAVIGRLSDKVDLDIGGVPAVQMDEQGFCNPKDSYGRKNIDIIGLGDSFSWCAGVLPEDTWPWQLAAASGYSAYNLSIQGIGPYEYLQVLKKFGLAKSPKIVIMAIFAGNDLGGAREFHEYRRNLAQSRGNENLIQPCVGLPEYACAVYRAAKEGPIGRSSYAFNLISNASREGLLKIKRRAGPAETPNLRYYVNLADGRTIRFNRWNNTAEWDNARRLRSGEISLNLFDEALAGFMELSRQHNFHPIVALIPSVYDVYSGNAVYEDPEIGELVRWFGEEERKYFKAKGGELGYDFVDFAPALAAAAAVPGHPLLYFPTDIHLTKDGYAVLAKAMNEFLRQNKILARNEL